MSEMTDESQYLAKAERSLAGADSEFANGRYENCVNRCYYACFQAAVAALIRGGIRSPGRNHQWSHTFVQSQFVGVLINRRHFYSADLRRTLAELISLRHSADYDPDPIPEAEAYRALRRARPFVRGIQEVGGTLR